MFCADLVWLSQFLRRWWKQSWWKQSWNNRMVKAVMKQPNIHSLVTFVTLSWTLGRFVLITGHPPNGNPVLRLLTLILMKIENRHCNIRITGKNLNGAISDVFKHIKHRCKSSVKPTIYCMVRFVLARIWFICIKQEQQWRAESINVLCRLKNQAWVGPPKSSLSRSPYRVLPPIFCVEFPRKFGRGYKLFCSFYGINPIEIQNLISIQVCSCNRKS